MYIGKLSSNTSCPKTSFKWKIGEMQRIESIIDKLPKIDAEIGKMISDPKISPAFEKLNKNVDVDPSQLREFYRQQLKLTSTSNLGHLINSICSTEAAIALRKKSPERFRQLQISA